MKSVADALSGETWSKGGFCVMTFDSIRTLFALNAVVPCKTSKQLGMFPGSWASKGHEQNNRAVDMAEYLTHKLPQKSTRRGERFGAGNLRATAPAATAPSWFDLKSKATTVED